MIILASSLFKSPGMGFARLAARDHLEVGCGLDEGAMQEC